MDGLICHPRPYVGRTIEKKGFLFTTEIASKTIVNDALCGFGVPGQIERVRCFVVVHRGRHVDDNRFARSDVDRAEAYCSLATQRGNAVSIYRR